MQDEEITADVMISADPAASDPEAMRLMEEAEHEAKIAKLVALRALVQRLATKRDESIKAKRPIEEMMCDSLRMIRGDGRYQDATKSQSVNSDSNNRPPRPKILRSRTRRWEARMCDMLSANPWDLEPDSENGVIDPMAEVEQQTRAEKMKETIQKQFSWCRFDRSIRNMCHDAAHIGTGLIIGPRKAVRRKRRYQALQALPAPANDWQQEGFVPAPAPVPQATTSQMVVEEYLVPEFAEGDPFCFYPDMTVSAEKAEYAHYVYLLGKMEVKNLAPGFDEMQINALLKKDPEHGELAVNLRKRSQYLGTDDLYRDRYAVWRYTGVLGREDLEVLGLCECADDLPDTDLGSPEPPEMAMADIWYCQDFILRASLTPVPDDFRIPYLVFAPFKLDGSMFGMSLAMMGEDSDRVAASAWLATLHSASVSAGPQIVYTPGAIEPADNQSSVRGPKTWKKKDKQVPINQIFEVVHIPSTVEQDLLLFDRAVALLDEELDTLQWADNDMTAENSTASGLAMIMNASSILQIMVASTADDDVFEPAVDRAIWWNNDNNPDDSIKGNFIVKPLVQNERLVKDVQMQHAMTFIAMSDNPRFQGMSNDYELYKYAASFMDGPISEFVLSKEDYEQAQQNRPPDPAQIQAQVLQIEAETQKLKAQRETILAQTDQIKQQIAVLELQAAQNPQVDNSLEWRELELKQEQLALDRDKITAQLQMADQRNQTVRDQTAAKLNQQRQEAAEFNYEKQQDRQSKLMMKGMDMERDAQEKAVKIRTGSGW